MRSTSCRWTACEKTHDWFRKPGSFAVTLEKIGCINRAGIRSGDHDHRLRRQHRRGPRHHRRGRRRRARTSSPSPATARPARRRTSGIEPAALPASCWRTATKSSGPTRPPAARPISTKKTTSGRSTNTRRAHFKFPDGREEGMIYGGCNCGNCHLTILPTGDVYACRRVQNSRVGNVFEDRLADLWVSQAGSITGTTGSLRNAQSANCWPSAGAARRSPAAGTAISTPPIPQCWKEVDAG